MIHTLVVQRHASRYYVTDQTLWTVPIRERSRSVWTRPVDGQCSACASSLDRPGEATSNHHRFTGQRWSAASAGLRGRSEPPVMTGAWLAGQAGSVLRLPPVHRGLRRVGYLGSRPSRSAAWASWFPALEAVPFIQRVPLYVQPTATGRRPQRLRLPRGSTDRKEPVARSTQSYSETPGVTRQLVAGPVLRRPQVVTQLRQRFRRPRRRE